MEFQHRMLRTAVLAVTDKALRDIPRDPRRSLRNLVDLGASCASGAQQKRFFARAQAALASPSSPYYKLATRAVASVDAQRLRILAENVGGSALTYGVSQLRRREQELGCRLPWLVAFDQPLPADSPLIREANSFGCYAFLCWGAPVAAVCALARRNPYSAFLASFSPEEIGPAQAQTIRETPNLIVSVVLDGREDGAEAFALLREARCLFGCLARCAADDFARLTGAEFQNRLIEQGCLYLSLYPDPIDGPISGQLDRYVQGARGREKGRPLLLFQLPRDLWGVAEAVSPGSPVLRADPTRGLLEQLDART